MRGYFGIGAYNIKNENNIGTLWRSAHAFGASFIFVIGRRYKKQASDTSKAYKHIPLINYRDFDHFYSSIPYNCRLIGIENDNNARCLVKFCHPQNCIYLLGAEDTGLPNKIISKCWCTIKIPTIFCINVSMAGSIVLYDRIAKLNRSTI